MRLKLAQIPMLVFDLEVIEGTSVQKKKLATA